MCDIYKPVHSRTILISLMFLENYGYMQPPEKTLAIALHKKGFLAKDCIQGATINMFYMTHYYYSSDL